MNAPTKARPRSGLTAIPFWAVHAVAIAGIAWLGWSWTGLALALASYVVRMFFVTAGYHRYFSHRTFKTSRPFQFLLAFGAQTSAQKGVLWWAAHHRTHHKLSDQEGDVHSAKLDGFWYSHAGWILGPHTDATDYSKIRDFARYPELMHLNRRGLFLLPAVIYAIALALVGGAHALVWGFFVSTVLLWHGTFFINSLAHVWGRKRYATTDESRNNFWLAVITLGEGWHNNHHHWQSSTRQGFFWWELDPTYYVLKAMSWVRLVWDLREPPAELLDPKCPDLIAPAPAVVAAAEQSVPEYDPRAVPRPR
jgi:stearoyl-CoA desaturase (delta-9 desaturase)